MGPNNEVLNWMPDGKSILFLSRRDTFNSWFGRQFTVPEDGGLQVRLPLDKGGLASFSADGNQVAYNRIFAEFPHLEAIYRGHGPENFDLRFQDQPVRADRRLRGNR